MPNKFGTRTEYQPITYIDEVSVKEIMKEHGSPVYVLSEKTIRDTYKDAKKAFTARYPKVQFAWSYKTNYLNAVCNIFHQEGSWAEVVSGFEYDKAIANGVSGNHIIFNGPDKSESDLETAIINNSLIHIDHYDELYMIISLAEKLEKKPKVAIRVNMDTGISPQWSRFGFNYESGEAWDALNRILINKNLELVGLHSHIGTYILTANAYNVAGTKLADLAVRVKEKYNHAIKYIDFGGGFASKNTLIGAYLPGTDTCPTFSEYAEAITTSIINSRIKLEDFPTIILETGRALIDDAGFILGTVLANKRLADGSKSMVINVGVNLLFTAFWYEHRITPAQNFSSHTEHTSVYGPLCMNIDVIRQTADLPVMRKGDDFVISRIGAYNMTQWMQFITLRPKIVIIDTGRQVHVIRKNEKNEDINSFEHVPDHLKKINV